MSVSLPELELDEIERQLLACLKNSMGMAKNCAHHAVQHLERAWRLSEIDPEMAAFRAITAEEEAATAILVTLRERRYAGIQKRHFHDHAYKQGLLPFVLGVTKFVRGLKPLPEMRLRVADETGTKRLRLQLKFPGHEWAEPQPPLGFEITSAETGRAVDFASELEELAGETGKKAILDDIRARAQIRNHLLYADYDGIPKVSDGIQLELEKRRANVFILLTIFCLLAPYKEHAVFVQQAVNAYLKAMKDVAPRAHEIEGEDANEAV